ncbi:glycosyltransferase [Alteribacillus sp. HJP-4]|uniref:glycosyltransferase n=1 Tax=Alteribacillus sp. HJP-4 TaxID=2775394 RepID=UPI0035CCF5F0
MKEVTAKVSTIINESNLIDSKEENEAVFYAQQALEELKQKGNIKNAWLWVWRGLNKHSENIILLQMMVLLSRSLGREKEALRYGEKVKTIPGDVSNDLYAPSIYSENKGPKILHGTMEIANQMNTISKGLTHKGYVCETLTYYAFYLGYQSDYLWDLSKEKNKQELPSDLLKVSKEFMKHIDIFHFHFGTSFTQNNSDLQMLKACKKTMLMHHWGSDVRILSKALKVNPFAKAKTTNEAMIKRKLQFLSQYIPCCIVADQEVYQYVKEYYKKVFIVPLMVDLDNYKPVIQAENPKIKIVHAPTSPEVKGTTYVLKAINNLQKSYDIDFQLIQGKSHQEAKKMYQTADIVIDQLHIGSYGLLAVETMAMGKPVVCWISDYMKNHYPADLPIISANPDTIEEKLKELLNNRDMLSSLGMKSRQYAETHHDMHKNSQQMLEIYQSLS